LLGLLNSPIYCIMCMRCISQPWYCDSLCQGDWKKVCQSWNKNLPPCVLAA